MSSLYEIILFYHEDSGDMWLHCLDKPHIFSLQNFQ